MVCQRMAPCLPLPPTTDLHGVHTDRPIGPTPETDIEHLNRCLCAGAALRRAHQLATSTSVAPEAAHSTTRPTQHLYADDDRTGTRLHMAQIPYLMSAKAAATRSMPARVNRSMMRPARAFAPLPLSYSYMSRPIVASLAGRPLNPCTS